MIGRLTALLASVALTSGCVATGWLSRQTQWRLDIEEPRGAWLTEEGIGVDMSAQEYQQRIGFYHQEVLGERRLVHVRIPREGLLRLIIADGEGPARLGEISRAQLDAAGGQVLRSPDHMPLSEAQAPLTFHDETGIQREIDISHFCVRGEDRTDWWFYPALPVALVVDVPLTIALGIGGLITPALGLD